MKIAPEMYNEASMLISSDRGKSNKTNSKRRKTDNSATGPGERIDSKQRQATSSVGRQRGTSNKTVQQNVRSSVVKQNTQALSSISINPEILAA